MDELCSHIGAKRKFVYDFCGHIEADRKLRETSTVASGQTGSSGVTSVVISRQTGISSDTRLGSGTGWNSGVDSWTETHSGVVLNSSQRDS